MVLHCEALVSGVAGVGLPALGLPWIGVECAAEGLCHVDGVLSVVDGGGVAAWTGDEEALWLLVIIRL